MSHAIPRLAIRGIALCAALWAVATGAQNLTPGANLVIDGVPPIPEALVAKVQAYTEFKPSALLAWDPAKSGVLIRRRAGNVNQLHYVSTPGGAVSQLTDFPDAVSSASFQPKTGAYLVFAKANGGDEVYRLYRLDMAGKTVTAISDDKERAGPVAWNRAGDRIVYASVGIDRNSKERKAVTRVYVADPLKPEETRNIATLDGGGFSGFRFSPDGKSLVYQEYVSANESHLWTMSLGGGDRRRLSRPPAADTPTIYYGDARFSRDGKGVYAISDRDSEFRRLIYIDLASGNERVLTGHLKFDVDSYALSNAAKRIAVVMNEDGSSVLRLFDLATEKELPRPALLPGEIAGLRWSGGDEDDGDGRELGFTLTSARSPGDAYSFNLATGKITRWTNSASPDLNPMDFVEPRLVRWKSFDGLAISGFLYQPDAKKFPGKRPVIINIHGGPEGQARPGFISRSNYMVNELGIAVIYPNVRGSTGFGKTFLALDNGMKREDSVKDIGALLDWIGQQPDLDAGKVLVTGGSYGGYMSLAVSTHYADRITGSIDVVGISNFITFLTNTESYRRDLRRVEYGDERDPAMRAFFEKISPLNNAAKITKPMFVVQGRNDPRVPYTEAEQIVAQLKKQKTPVWFLMANDEGHGFAKKNNADYLFYAQILFMEQTLLK